MATKVVMAQLSPTMEEGRLVEWKLEEGDEVVGAREALRRHERTGRSPLSRWQVHRFVMRP